MKFHFVMTTIHTPTVLAKYTRLEGAQDVTFHVVLDWKSNQSEVAAFIRSLPSTVDLRALTPEEIKKRPYSNLLGFNHDSLRVVAFLDAYKDGADVVITADDDNEPEENFFQEYHGLFEMDQISGTVSDWAHSLPEPLFARGFPYAKRSLPPLDVRRENRRVEFHQGLTYGDPDVDALTRANGQAYVERGQLQGRGGVLFGHQPVNTQNSALRREFVPYWWAPSWCGRNWDIVAGYLVQNLFELDERASSGAPYTHSKRNEHDNRADIRNEDVGAYLCEALAAGAGNVRPLPGEALLARYRRIGLQLQGSSDRYVWHLGEAVLAWANALEKAGVVSG